jgi:dimethylhistidine N-methyltransferase
MHAVLEAVAPVAPQAPAASLGGFARDVLEGLSRRQRAVPGRWLHDRRGSLLFEQITEQPEYYLARTEQLLLGQCAGAIAEAAGPAATLVELRSASGRGSPLLWQALDRPAAHGLVDLDEGLDADPRQARLAPEFAALTRWPLAPGVHGDEGRRIVFFPGGSLCNLTPEDASALLETIGRWAGLGSLLVAGVDHTRDPAALVAAYDDRAGYGAAFDKNLLLRINRELAGDFDATAFRHLACFDPAAPRVETHLVATRSQRVSVLGQRFDFAAGESIHTGHAYKPSLFQFLALAHRAGWAQRQLWMGAAAGYAVHVLENVLAL